MNSIITPQFTVSDIQIGVDESVFKKSMALFEKGAVKNIEGDYFGFKAIVSGTNEYEVYVSAKSYDRGGCDCYVGQREELCKHMLALAIALVYEYRPNETNIIQQPLDQAVCLGEVRDITDDELKIAKQEIAEGMKYIKSYGGGSAQWFRYQDSLIKGSRLILLALSNIPICEKSVMVCINVLKRLDKKVLKGVDDSDGTVGEMMCQIVEILNLYVSFDNSLKEFIERKLPKGESFDWERGFGIL